MVEIEDNQEDMLVNMLLQAVGQAKRAVWWLKPPVKVQRLLIGLKNVILAPMEEVQWKV